MSKVFLGCQNNSLYVGMWLVKHATITMATMGRTILLLIPAIIRLTKALPLGLQLLCSSLENKVNLCM